ncbi:MAG TPA: D-alanine--D-alanine ligase family protein [Anaerolineaceae bacterium]|nr:D-alanine--D-alanine ligase family protein [Anaerolineaceae bacterium]
MVAQRLNVGVIFGGRSGEHEVSLMSARSILAVLDPSKYTVIPIGITRKGAWVTGSDAGATLAALEAQRENELSPAAFLPDTAHCGVYRLEPAGREQVLRLLAALDVVFPVLHGTFGEDGTLQGLLELADVAYVGAGVLGSAVGMDKPLFKDVMRANGIPVAESTLIFRSQIEKDPDGAIRQAEQLAAYPLFVKPANLGSSVGVTKCRGRSDLVEGLLDATRYDRRVLVERGINALEIEVSVLGNEAPQASVPGQIIPADEFYSYSAKYLDKGSRLVIPAPLSAEKTEEVRDVAVRVFRAVDCAGMARVDFLIDRESGQVFVSEINTIPGFTRISMYPKLWEASGLPYPALVDRLIELALERKADRDRTEHEYGRAR